jgi:hypothetical protein
LGVPAGVVDADGGAFVGGEDFFGAGVGKASLVPSLGSGQAKNRRSSLA